jgi:hypothetical protein
MNRIILTLLTILFFSGLANAQFSKGNFLLGGTLSYSTSSSSGTSTGTEYNAYGGFFNVSLGKAVNENSVFGINLTYGFNKYAAVYNKTNYYSIGVFYRKYKSLGKDFYLSGEAAAGYNGSNSYGTDNSGNQYLSGNTNGGFISFYPAIDYKISKKFFLEISMPSLFTVSYSSTKSTDPNLNPQTSTGSQFGIATSLSANPLNALAVGFRLIL